MKVFLPIALCMRDGKHELCMRFRLSNGLFAKGHVATVWIVCCVWNFWVVLDSCTV